MRHSFCLPGKIQRSQEKGCSASCFKQRILTPCAQHQHLQVKKSTLGPLWFYWSILVPWLCVCVTLAWAKASFAMDIARSPARSLFPSPAVITVYVSAPLYCACVLEAERLQSRRAELIIFPSRLSSNHLRELMEIASACASFLLPLLAEPFREHGHPQTDCCSRSKLPGSSGQGVHLPASRW